MSAHLELPCLNCSLWWNGTLRVGGHHVTKMNEHVKPINDNARVLEHWSLQGGLSSTLDHFIKQPQTHTTKLAKKQNVNSIWRYSANFG